MSDLWQQAFIAAWFKFQSARPYMMTDEEHNAERRQWAAAHADLAIAELERHLKRAK